MHDLGLNPELESALIFNPKRISNWNAVTFNMVLSSPISYAIAFLPDKGMKDFSQRVLYIIKDKPIKKKK
ncbi:hypothetical protein HR10_00710 [Porphyromonas gulae]|uniref:Uncharacterized protein n=1 Tax=Porphyromonas gulae TaxID=111105 RepID=A0A0A2F7Z6_9PORP|nr:hypothetical protein HR15_07150 [Porphyromonas gulae]KKC52042.1 hypothetical protein HR10_00710 [Porphyromonas gulae]